MKLNVLKSNIRFVAKKSLWRYFMEKHLVSGHNPENYTPPIQKELYEKGSMKMKELPVCDRPYEKLEKLGERNLTDTELLAIILKSGSKGNSAFNLAQRIMGLDRHKKGISFLCNLQIEDLKKLPGIGKVKAIGIKAAIELGRRTTRNPIVFGETIIRSPADMVTYMKCEMDCLSSEELNIVLLDSKNAVMRICKCGNGSIKETVFSPRDIFKDALKYDASSIILVHNHPSGNPAPSDSDLKTTKELMSMGKQLGIEILDHVIIGRNGYESIKEKIFVS